MKAIIRLVCIYVIDPVNTWAECYHVFYSLIVSLINSWVKLLLNTCSLPNTILCVENEKTKNMVFKLQKNHREIKYIIRILKWSQKPILKVWRSQEIHDFVRKELHVSYTFIHCQVLSMLATMKKRKTENKPLIAQSVLFLVTACINLMDNTTLSCYEN